MGNIYFSVVFYINDKHTYANIKNKNFNKYYMNMVNLYQTINISQNKNKCKMNLFTNKNIPDEFKNIFNELEVEVILSQNNHLPPEGYSDMWQGTFFYIDAIEYYSKIMNNDDILIMLDPDCIVLKDFSPILKKIQNDKVLNYQLYYPIEQSQNGLSMLELSNILKDESDVEAVPEVYGGEIYGFSGSIINRFSKELELAWNMSIRRFNENKTYFKTEEHIFTYVFYKLSYIKGNANEFIKRIWTAPIYRNVEKDDDKYIIWHLPAEKNRGLIKIYKKYLKNNNNKNKLNGKQLEKVFGKIIGIPKKNIFRYSYDSLYVLAKKVVGK
ncbi:MAG: hypothetical protein SOT71_10175 [Romboutsia timonensis]|uniref:hypothetical protein n=1 Tax=Romboutsia timonensis TaxID=1776391 RepID=UPI002A762A62|nr:hypothetical protein [Romboutsia timonensis]MDY2883006.1 hypothetical protein [Romboutsia timonensis]